MRCHPLHPLAFFAATLALSTPTVAATFTDDFSSGLNSTYWSVTQTTPGLYNVNASGGQVALSRTVHAPTVGAQNVFVRLNLGAVGGNIAGDFDTEIQFNNAVLGNGLWDQAEFHAEFANGSYFFDVHDNSNFYVNNHVWYNSSGPFAGAVGGGYHNDPTTGGAFRITRVGSLVSGWYDSTPDPLWTGSTLLFSTNNAAALSGVSFMLQNNLTNDMISVNIDNFKLTAASVAAPIPEPETYAMLLSGLSMLAVVARRRQRNRQDGRN